MISLYVTSLQSGDGKTTFSAGLARLFQDSNQRVGFLKPVVAGPELQGDDGHLDPDAAFLHGALALEEPAASATVVGSAESLKNILRTAASALAAKKDVLIVEGLNIGLKDPAQAQLSTEMARALEARVIVVVRYGSSSETVTQSVQRVGERLLGIVVNAVPPSRLQQARDSLIAPLETIGIRTLTVIPEDRLLFGVSVADLAEGLGGKVLVNADRMDAIAENFMLGAMTLESGKTYFGRKANKVAIIRGERPDMMLAAMHTSTVGIITTGDYSPSDQTMLEAEVKKIPIIAVRRSTAEVAAEVEKIVSVARFRQVKKLDRLAQLLAKTLDFKALSKAL